MQDQFKKVSRTEVDRILKQGVFQKAQLSFNFLNRQKVIKVKLATIPYDASKRMYVLPLEIEELKDRMCAFSFKIGTQMYFFKGKVRVNARGFYIEGSVGFFELVRRKHIRFEKNEQYPIDCGLVLPDGQGKVRAQLLNISSSGASMRLDDDFSLYKKNQIVHALIRPVRRAGVTVQGLIRYVKRKNNAPTEVGIEFSQLDEVQRNKIKAICEDLSFYIFAE